MAIAANGQPTYFNISQPQYNMCVQIVQAAQASWLKMVTQFAAENIAMGISQAGKTSLIADTLQIVNVYGSTGSLWQAFDALSKIVITPEMAPYLTEDRREWMKNQIVESVGTLLQQVE